MFFPTVRARVICSYYVVLLLCCVWYVDDGCKQLQCVKEKLRPKHLEFIP